MSSSQQLHVVKPESQKPKWSLSLLKLFLLVILLGGILFKTRFSPTPVRSHRLDRGEVTVEVLGTGTLEARIKTTMSPRIPERLAEVLVDQGDAVAEGQLLARLDDGELRRQVEVAEAALNSSRATAERVRVDEVRAQAVERQARQDHQRVADLVNTKISSQAELDKAVEQLRIAESEWTRAQAATVEAQQQVRLAEKNLEYQRERLSFTQIKSPYAGLVTRRDRDPGGVVVPGSSILQVISTNELWISAWVDETSAQGLAVGQKARVIFRSEPSKNYEGVVIRLGRETDRETREFIVDVRAMALPSNWTLGQRAEVFIATDSRSDVIVVPLDYIQWRNGKPGLLIEERGTAVWRDVTLGQRGRDVVAVAGNVSAGELALAAAEPQISPLKPGKRVVLQ